MNYIAFKIFIAIGKAIALLPMRALYILSDLIYPIVYYLIRYRRRIVYENLRNSFPEKSDKEIELIAKKFYRFLCDLLVEVLKLLHMKPDEMSRRFKFRDNSLILEEFGKKKHILAVLGHYGNWEWGSSLVIKLPYNFAGIYKPLSNKYFDELMIKLRTQFGSEAIPMKQTARVLAAHIREKKLTILNFIADQSPHTDEIHYWTKFLNQDTPVFLGIEKFARKTRQPVIFLSIIRVKRGYYEVEVEKLCDDCNMLSPNELTEMHVKKLEELIRKAPEYWLWSHRRWKNKRQQ
jgi:KDO2-lipid IV(A) lauroyltransferase